MQILEMKGKDDPSKMIISWEQAKQTNEQKMLFELNKLFKQWRPTAKMRRVVLNAFNHMDTEVSLNKPGPAQQAIEDESNLAVWEKVGPMDWKGRLTAMRNLLGKQLGEGDALDCDDLSELMRVVGAWLEKGGGFGGYVDFNKAFRVGIGKAKIPRADERDIKVIKSLPKGPNQMAPDALQAIKNQEAPLWKDFRQREDAKKDASDHRSFHHEIPQYLAPYWVRPKRNKESGTQMFQANRNDLCKKIDLLFGLYKGATLSGTTTDTVGVLESFGQQIGDGKQLPAGYYLFPVATIAASLHHSLLEVALSLTLDGAIESYCVGFYSTLQPKGSFPPELEDAKNILEKAEVAPDNRHLVIWYDGKEEDKPVGCLLLDKKVELIAFRRLVEARGLLTHVGSMPAVPTKKDVMRLINIMAPTLLAHLPQEFHQRLAA